MRIKLSTFFVLFLLVACNDKQSMDVQPNSTSAEQEKIQTQDEGIAALILRLRKKEGKTIEEVANVLAGFGESAIPLLIEALQDEDSFVRATAVHALRELGSKAHEAIPHLAGCLDDSSFGVRRQASSTLGCMGEKSLPYLAETLQHPSLRSIEPLSRAMGIIGKPAIPVLLKALKSENAGSRMIAVKALGEMQEEAEGSIPCLIEVLQDENWYVSFESSNALKKITSQDFGADYEKWKAWYEKNKDK